MSPNGMRNIASQCPSFGVCTRFSLKKRILGPVEFHQPEVATVDQLKAVHTLDYIQQFLENRLDKSAARRIGLPWTEGLARRTITAVGGTILT